MMNEDYLNVCNECILTGRVMCSCTCSLVEFLLLPSISSLRIMVRISMENKLDQDLVW